jgi:hypothetical protein
MDNRINEYRRRIGVLRTEMMDLEQVARAQIKQGVDCGAAALTLLGKRRELLILIEEWKSAGGGDQLPEANGRFGRNPRPGEKISGVAAGIPARR